MELVVDANVIISSLISCTGKTCETLFSDKLKLYVPEFLLEEIYKYKEEISEKSGLSKEKIDILFSLISLNFEIVPLFEFSNFLEKASKICPDTNDIEYFALALKLNFPLWSNDKKLKQGSLKVLNTSEVLTLIL
ncbi:MAG: PIN domain-containing protein [Candidatus Pacearchaeota archaeon]|nr:PIN domain-containing protein [Candidatus Pacearchaeota archaeon]